MMEDVLQTRTGIYKWLVAGGVTFAGAVIYVNITRHLRLVPFGTTFARSYNLQLAILAAIGVVIVIALVRQWDKELARQGFLLGVLAILGVYTWGTAWWMTREGAADSRESWITSATDNDLLLLGNELKDISAQLTGSERDLQLVSTIDSPSLRWYLRSMVNTEYGQQLSPGLNSMALLTLDSATPVLSDSYIGTDFGHLRPDTPHTLSLAEALSWWLFHQSPWPVPEERIMLWIRSDLVGANP